MISSIVKSQVRLSRGLDSLLPERYIIDGNEDFVENLLPKYLRPSIVIYDIGGGKSPYLGRDRKKALGAKVVGLDICQKELDEAPAGAYDEKVCADIAQYRGKGDADLVICQALLEHVKDTRKAFQGIASILKPDGLALIFVPSRNAAFARLNIVLPQKVKKMLLFGIFPNVRRTQGFPGYYNRCTPKDFKDLAIEHGFEIKEERHYYISSYFSFFFPLYLVWRLWVLGFHFVRGAQAAETFSMALLKH